jgi:cytochrome c
MRAVCMIPVALALGLAACGGGAPAAPAAEAPAVPAPTLAELPAPYNEADLGKGKDAFGRKCGACHFLPKDRGNQVGPNLHGVFDRGVAELANYTYSPALKDFEAAAWTPELVDQWLQSPDSFVPGTSMRLNGIIDANERRDLIAHLLIASRQ